MPRARLATFDCYGTLVDWEGGAATFLYGIALREGDSEAPNGRALRDRWEELQFELVSGPYKPYKQILAESLRAWADERGNAGVRFENVPSTLKERFSTYFRDFEQPDGVAAKKRK